MVPEFLRCQLSAERSYGVNNCEDILVGKVLPWNQNLIMEELDEKENDWQVQSQLEGLEAETCTISVGLGIGAVHD